MEMTLRKALEIQAKQVATYSHRRHDLAEAVAAITNVAGYDLDKPMATSDINRLVPRGWDIVDLCNVDFSGN